MTADSRRYLGFVEEDGERSTTIAVEAKGNIDAAVAIAEKLQEIDEIDADDVAVTVWREGEPATTVNIPVRFGWFSPGPFSGAGGLE
jgi:hypothetical protein